MPLAQEKINIYILRTVFYEDCFLHQREAEKLQFKHCKLGYIVSSYKAIAGWCWTMPLPLCRVGFFLLKILLFQVYTNSILSCVLRIHLILQTPMESYSNNLLMRTHDNMSLVMHFNRWFTSQNPYTILNSTVS